MLTKMINNQNRKCFQAFVLTMSCLMLLEVAPQQAFAEGEHAPVRDSKRIFYTKVESWTARKQKYVVMQERDFSCGAAVLATMIKYYWNGDTSEDQLIREMEKMLNQEEIKDRVENGLTMTDLRKLAVRQGYQATIGKLSFNKLTESKIPLIVGIVSEGYDHFVLFRGFDGRWVYLADPARGNIRVPAQQFVDEWQKNMALVVVRKNSKPRKWSPLHLRLEEVDTGVTNQKLLQMFPSRVTTRPNAMR